MPRPRITEPEIPSFDEAIASFNGYPSPVKVPRILWQRIRQVIDQQRIPMDRACDAISRLLSSTREEVRSKLTACEPPMPAGFLTTKPRPEAWPRVRTIYRKSRD